MYFFLGTRGNKSECGTNKSSENGFGVHAICLSHAPIHSLMNPDKKDTHSLTGQDRIMRIIIEIVANRMTPRLPWRVRVSCLHAIHVTNEDQQSKYVVVSMYRWIFIYGHCIVQMLVITLKKDGFA